MLFIDYNCRMNEIPNSDENGMMYELVDILRPPDFQPSGIVKQVTDAIDAGDWIGVMNLWLVRSDGRIIYQQRPSSGGWQPGKLDGSVGGYYQSGEFGLDGLREAEEELGVGFPFEDVTRLGRHLSVGVDSAGRERHLVATVYMTLCDRPLSDFVLNPAEVPAIFDIASRDVVKSFERPRWESIACGIDCRGHPLERRVTASDFTYIFGDYHLKIARIAKKYAGGDREFWY